jgi:hypothetical protein
MQKYRFDHDGPACPNGSVPIYSHWLGGPSLSGIRNCPTSFEATPRMVYITGEPDTYFSVPACCKFAGKRIKGWVGQDESGYVFHAQRDMPAG